MENEFYSFKQYLEEFTRNFKPYRYDTDIMYRAVCFNKHGRVYLIYCQDRKLVHEYADIQFEIRAYEKRVEDARYSGKIA